MKYTSCSIFLYASGLSRQRTLAKELHKIANVPLRQCDLDDVKAFQSALPGYQINVVTKDCFNSITYKGPEAVKEDLPISSQQSLCCDHHDVRVSE